MIKVSLASTELLAHWSLYLHPTTGSYQFTNILCCVSISLLSGLFLPWVSSDKILHWGGRNFTQEETAIIIVTVMAWKLYSYLKGNKEIAKFLK